MTAGEETHTFLLVPGFHNDHYAEIAVLAGEVIFERRGVSSQAGRIVNEADEGLAVLVRLIGG